MANFKSLCVLFAIFVAAVSAGATVATPGSIANTPAGKGQKASKVTANPPKANTQKSLPSSKKVVAPSVAPKKATPKNSKAAPQKAAPKNAKKAETKKATPKNSKAAPQKAAPKNAKKAETKKATPKNSKAASQKAAPKNAKKAETKKADNKKVAGAKSPYPKK